MVMRLNISKVLLTAYRKGIKPVSGHGFANYYVVRIVRNFLLRHLKQDIAEIQGHTIFLDPLDSLGLSKHGVFEPLETEVVKKEIKKGDVVIDVGANIGYYTLLFAKLVGEEGRVYAFEPDPDNFELLKRNVEINRYENVVLVQKAVSQKTEEIKLYLSARNKGDHRTYTLNDNRDSIAIQSTSLDDYFEADGRIIDFIKMDIQGSEGDAVLGMQSLFRQNQHLTLISEFWPIGLQRFGIEPAEYLNLLTSSGFQLYDMNEGEKRVQKCDSAALLDKYTPENGIFTNLLCVKNSHHDPSV